MDQDKWQIAFLASLAASAYQTTIDPKEIAAHAAKIADAAVALCDARDEAEAKAEAKAAK